jgi:HPt (histidine-containing phosphotransfer) domain-containing protein
MTPNSTRAVEDGTGSTPPPRLESTNQTTCGAVIPATLTSGSTTSADNEPDEDVEEEGVIDVDTFSQILELDDGDEQEFSKGMVDEYLAQAAETFRKLDVALQDRDLSELSSLSHYLKGSSGTLGVIHIHSSCDKIHCWAQQQDPDTGNELTVQEALDMITKRMKRVKKEYAAAEKCLKKYFVQ